MIKNIVVLVLSYFNLSSFKKGYFDKIISSANLIKDANVNIVLIDNHSRDGTIEYIKANYPKIELLSTVRNVLYCKAINSGLQYAWRKYKPDAFILVDADNPTESQSYQILVNAINENPQAGIIQPLVKDIDNDKILYSCGHNYNEDWECRPLRQLPENLETIKDLPSCSISSTIISSEVFLKCGLLFPDFEIYYESSDLGFRARNKGFLCQCVTEAVCYNKGGITSPLNQMHSIYYSARNHLYFVYRQKPELFSQILNSKKDWMSFQKKQFDRLTNNSEKYCELLAQYQGIRDAITRIKDNENFLKKSEPRLEDFDSAELILIQT